MKTIRISAAIIRDEAGRFLLVRKRGSEIFFQPGGKIDDGEDPETCLLREIEEELGIRIGRSQLRYAAKMAALPPTKRMRRWKPSFTILRWRKGRCPSPPARLRNCGGTRRATPRGLSPFCRRPFRHGLPERASHFFGNALLRKSFIRRPPSWPPDCSDAWSSWRKRA